MSGIMIPSSQSSHLPTTKKHQLHVSLSGVPSPAVPVVHLGHEQKVLGLKIPMSNLVLVHVVDGAWATDPIEETTDSPGAKAR